MVRRASLPARHAPLGDCDLFIWAETRCAPRAGGLVTAGPHHVGVFAALFLTAALFCPTPAQSVQATAVLTRPDEGVSGHTYRWDPPNGVVSYHIEVPYERELIRRAFAWDSAVTGLTFAETQGAADIVIASENDNGAYTVASVDGGRIFHATVQIGCVPSCRLRPLWEDLTQVTGPMGDRASGQWSLFSSDKTLETPTAFDAWVIHTLYSLPPGATVDQVRAAVTRPCSVERALRRRRG
jgi:Protein of unknown function (DUF2927)